MKNQTGTSHDFINNLRLPTKENPLRILMSACLAGVPCGYDQTANGVYPSALKILSYPTAKVIRFCPEEFSFGSPRAMCDIHGGDGFDVWEGRAKVLTSDGEDWTEGMKAAAEKMLALAESEAIEIAVLMDISAACGSTVVYQGNRFAAEKRYQAGVGVVTALLRKSGFRVISQRDFASLELLYAKLDPSHFVDSQKIDHQETEWYQNYFK
ncbi:DUF523 domain-containing protein [Hugenholtzia roseola]|uniref:DUF523 domain-containing protein n=1 Tax=Hugenholtzia roseola TaxID=1002 RepID=UPI00041CEC11|nr:DUF523 domain-containing protein [Hugenholtzia roseola]